MKKLYFAAMMDVLKSYLVQNKSINIPGLGTIYLEIIPAHNDFVNKQFYAPSFIYRFDKYFDAPDKEFFNYIASHKNMADYEAIKWYSEFAYNLRAEIRSKEMAEWEGIGTFKKDASGEIIFEEKILENSLFLTVPAERIVRTNASHHMLVGDRETTTTQMSELLNEVYTEKEPWWLYALILAAIGLCLVFFHFYKYGMNIGSLFN